MEKLPGQCPAASIPKRGHACRVRAAMRGSGVCLFRRNRAWAFALPGSRAGANAEKCALRRDNPLLKDERRETRGERKGWRKG